MITGVADPVENLVSHLEGVRKSGNGYSAKCPAHEDRHASLTLSTGNDGRALVKCQAGCATRDIVAAIGLTMADLFPPREAKPTSGKVYTNGSGRVVALYDYRDAEGEVVARKTRYEPKGFRQSRPDGNGGWISNLDGVTPPLYRLPELLNSAEDRPDEWVFLCEGEKDVDRLIESGLIATTHIGGAGKWKEHDSAHLIDRRVVILTDNDDAGYKHGQTVRAMLHDKAVEVRIIDLPDLPPKGDVSDWLNAGGTVQQLLQFVEHAKPCAGEKIAPEAHPATFRELAKMFPELRPSIIEGLLRRGETMNIIAPPKTGKSWMVIALALCVATGRAWLDLFPTTLGNVLVMDNELHGETSANRIPKVANALGILFDDYADRLHVDNLRGKLRDIRNLESYFASIEPGQYNVIILDAFYRFMPANTDENDNGAVASIYNILDRYADRLKCCFILIHHSTKGLQSDKSVTDVGAGAGSQSRATDTHLILRQHEEDGVVVLDAAVRSWKPIDPVCLRWEFPAWHIDTDLDPTQLRKANRKIKRDEIASAPAEPKIVWTVEKFVESFLSADALATNIIIAKACAAMSERKAIKWLLLDRIAGPPVAADLIERLESLEDNYERTP